MYITVYVSFQNSVADRFLLSSGKNVHQPPQAKVCGRKRHTMSIRAYSSGMPPPSGEHRWRSGWRGVMDVDYRQCARPPIPTAARALRSVELAGRLLPSAHGFESRWQRALSVRWVASPPAIVTLPSQATDAVPSISLESALGNGWTALVALRGATAVCWVRLWPGGRTRPPVGTARRR